MIVLAGNFDNKYYILYVKVLEFNFVSEPNWHWKKIAPKYPDSWADQVASYHVEANIQYRGNFCDLLAWSCDGTQQRQLIQSDDGLQKALHELLAKILCTDKALASATQKVFALLEHPLQLNIKHRTGCLSKSCPESNCF